MNPESTGPGESRVSANRFCSNCGAERQAQANFCSSCGIPFTPSDGNNSSGGPDVSGAEVGEASRRLLWIAIATALVLGGLVVCGADWWIRNQELNSLVTRIEASERVLTDFNTSLDSAQSRVMTDLTSFGPEQEKRTSIPRCSTTAAKARFRPLPLVLRWLAPQSYRGTQAYERHRIRTSNIRTRGKST